MLAEGDVDAQPVPLRHQLVAPLLAHSEQHLELVLGRPETPARDPRERLADQPLVVRRHTDIALGVEQRVEAAEEMRAHRLEVGERDRRRLEVDALAEADARPEIPERLDVVERTPQPRLQHDADIVVAFLAELAIEPQRVVGRRRVLHVDPNKVAVARRGADDVEEVLTAEGVRQIEAERGDLDADVRVERGLVDRGEHVPVRLSDRAGLLLARDLLAEHVDGGHLPAAVQLADALDGLRQRRTGDVARGEELHDRLRDRRQETDEGGVEQRHGRGDSTPGSRGTLRAAS